MHVGRDFLRPKSLRPTTVTSEFPKSDSLIQGIHPKWVWFFIQEIHPDWVWISVDYFAVVSRWRCCPVRPVWTISSVRPRPPICPHPDSVRRTASWSARRISTPKHYRPTSGASSPAPTAYSAWWVAVCCGIGGEGWGWGSVWISEVRLYTKMVGVAVSGLGWGWVYGRCMCGVGGIGVGVGCMRRWVDVCVCVCVRVLSEVK